MSKLEQAAPQAFETWWELEGQQFLYALNTTTDDDIKLVAEIAWKNGAYCAEQEAVKESLTTQEPVAEVVVRPLRGDQSQPTTDIKWLQKPTTGKLYAHHVRTKDLTPDELFSIANKVGFDGELMKTNHDRGMPSIAEQYARAVIAADRELNK